MVSADPGSALSVAVLGSGSGLPGAARDTTSLLVGSRAGHVLVDCPGGIVHKLARRGLRPEDLQRVILTHNHVDHVYGLPHLLHALAIGPGRARLRIHAPQQTVETVRAMVVAHGLEGRRYPVLDLLPIDLRPGQEVVSTGGLRIAATPTEHGRDTVALRFADGETAFCHSSDTRPSEAVAALAAGVDLLLHDCAGPNRLRERFSHSHSSALEAGRLAAAAGVARLVLIHLGQDAEEHLDEVLSEARGSFAGAVDAANDGDVYEVGR